MTSPQEHKIIFIPGEYRPSYLMMKQKLIECFRDSDTKSSDTSLDMLATLYITKALYGCTYQPEIEKHFK
uniref:Uncharacterized protein n=1 Tax=Pithovirus LCPAC401 TaxID=2506595 RepID=A0A481Z9S6_9VIRU|nr:MAG: hypothetical protein LCPAC401_03010 [Pithovirus LCPAC401]